MRVLAEHVAGFAAVLVVVVRVGVQLAPNLEERAVEIVLRCEFVNLGSRLSVRPGRSADARQ